MAFSNNNFSGQTTTPVTFNLIIINALVMLADAVLQRKGIELNGLLGLHYFDASNYHIWQSVTYMFCHASFDHIFCNMLSLYMFGRLLEQVWGARRFLIYYLVCGVGAAVIQQLAWRFEATDLMRHELSLCNPNAVAEIATMSYGELSVYCESLLNHLVTVGASGSVFGILLAFGMMFPNATIFLLIPPIPLKAKWLVIGYGLFELFFGVAGIQSGVAHFAHLGGMLFGFLLIMMWRHDRRVNF